MKTEPRKMSEEEIMKAEKEGFPAILIRSPLGKALIFVPERSGFAEENCEGVEHLMRHGVPEAMALERMKVSAEMFYWWTADRLRGELADAQRELRRYRRRCSEDAEEIAELKQQLTVAQSSDSGPQSHEEHAAKAVDIGSISH